MAAAKELAFGSEGFRPDAGRAVVVKGKEHRLSFATKHDESIRTTQTKSTDVVVENTGVSRSRSFGGSAEKDES